MEEAEKPSFQAVRAYMTALEKAAAQVTRWKVAAPSQYEELSSHLARMEEGIACGLKSDEFKSE